MPSPSAEYRQLSTPAFPTQPVHPGGDREEVTVFGQQVSALSSNHGEDKEQEQQRPGLPLRFLTLKKVRFCYYYRQKMVFDVSHKNKMLVWA